MILIFDLDDTLYPEDTYVLSGFRAVAERGQHHFGLPADDSYRFMVDVLEQEGRGKVFDRWLYAHGLLTRENVRKCVKCYRHHVPDIRLTPVADRILRDHSDLPLYLVTDGHKIAQSRKVEALGLESRFKRIFITHRFGKKHSKPSTYCFEKIRAAESCEWQDMMYVGDNPAKDFVNLNPLGVKTVRVLSGAHSEADFGAGFDASVSIEDLSELPAIINAVR